MTDSPVLSAVSESVTPIIMNHDESVMTPIRGSYSFVRKFRENLEI